MRDEKDGKLVLMNPFFDSLQTARLLFSQEGEYEISILPGFIGESNENVDIGKLRQNSRFLEIKGVKEGNLRRDHIIEIKHKPDNQRTHKIVFVRDMENQKVEEQLKSPHLNLKEESQTNLDNNACSKCKKYFEQFNHFELSFDDRTEEIKKVNWQKSLDRFEKSLKECSLFSDFNFQRTRLNFFSTQKCF